MISNPGIKFTCQVFHDEWIMFDGINFVFEDGKSHSSLYKIPPYEFETEIITKKIRNGITENGGALTIFYDMTIGNDRRGVKMRIEVCIQ